jgi:hypothetical protein
LPFKQEAFLQFQGIAHRLHTHRDGSCLKENEFGMRWSPIKLKEDKRRNNMRYEYLNHTDICPYCGHKGIFVGFGEDIGTDITKLCPNCRMIINCPKCGHNNIEWCEHCKVWECCECCHSFTMDELVIKEE